MILMLPILLTLLPAIVFIYYKQHKLAKKQLYEEVSDVHTLTKKEKMDLLAEIMATNINEKISSYQANK